MKKIFAFFAILMFSFTVAKVNVNAFNTLFQYPSAPDTCTTLESRCNYSTLHFWDNFNFAKQLPAEKDSLLMQTMVDYLEIMRQANLNLGLGSIRTLMNKAQTNQLNFMKLLQFAEYLLYYNSVPLIDDVYLTFAQSAVDASWMKKDLKEHYAEEIRMINNSKYGSAVMNFSLTDVNGDKKKLYDMPTDTAQVILLAFVTDGTNSSIALTRLSTDLGLSNSIQQGFTKMFLVYVGNQSKEFLATANQYPDWTLVASGDAGKNLDIRIIPSVMVLDKDHVVQNKNVTIDDVKNAYNGN